MQMLSLITLPPCCSKPVKALFVLETQFKIFWMKTNEKGLWLSHWLTSKLHCQDPEKYKNIFKTVHLPSVFQSDCYEAMGILFALQNDAALTQKDREETNCWINIVISIFFAYKKYSCHFIKFRLNHWQMDYFEDVFYTFLCLDSVIYLAVKWDSHKPPGFHPKYLKLCFEDEQSFFNGFGTTSGQVINDKISILGWSIPLKCMGCILYIAATFIFVDDFSIFLFYHYLYLAFCQGRC